MRRDLILGTAGHIDHGKTTLIKALTGKDCDRLPEEKARGITIDLGFASLDLDPYRLGIVDVPGHERFVKNMLAGATGIDLAMLVISAKESVKPQTREHLDILQLLGVRQGVIALTMCDLVDPETREVVAMEVRELVQGTFLEKAPIVEVSAPNGQGIEELKAAIRTCCDQLPSRETLGWFRMPIDRSFVVQGHGTVVTGTVISGRIAVGDEVEWLPSGARVRIRSLQNHDESVNECHRGQRTAINLAGVHHEEVVRGQELATPGYLTPSRVVTVRLHCLKSMRRGIKHRLPVRFHAGTQEIMSTLSLLDCDSIEPGKWGLAQLFLESPATVAWGQPFILRESSATQTIGGGQVLQARAKKIRRRHLSVLERVEKLWTAKEDSRLIEVAWFSGYGGVTLADLVRDAGLAPEQAEEQARELVKRKELREFTLGAGKKNILLHRDLVEDLEGKLLEALDGFHKEFPLMTGHDRQKLVLKLDYIENDALVQAVVDGLIRSKKILAEGRQLASATFKPKLSAGLRKIKDKVVATFLAAQYQPPEPGAFANLAGGNAQNLPDLFEVCVAEGHLVKVGDGLYLHAEVEKDMRQKLLERLSTGEGITVAVIRDLLGTTRKYAVPLCEYLDRIGLTRREGDLRYLGNRELAGAPSSSSLP